MFNTSKTEDNRCCCAWWRFGSHIFYTIRNNIFEKIEYSLNLSLNYYFYSARICYTISMTILIIQMQNVLYQILPYVYVYLSILQSRTLKDNRKIWLIFVCFFFLITCTFKYIVVNLWYHLRSWIFHSPTFTFLHQTSSHSSHVLTFYRSDLISFNLSDQKSLFFSRQIC